MSDEKINILTGEYVTLSYGKAELVQRIGSVIIDWLALGLACYMLFEIEGFLGIPWGIRSVYEYVIFITLPFVDLFLEYITKGYTLGKKLLGIRIISDECVPPTFLQCFMRWLIFPIDFWVVGLILIGNKGQRLGDMASGCQCICDKENSQEPVDLDEEFNYLSPKYKVRYPEATKLTIKEVETINKVLYHKYYKVHREKTASLVEQKLGIKRTSNSTSTFLKKVLYDYKHMNM